MGWRKTGYQPYIPEIHKGFILMSSDFWVLYIEGNGNPLQCSCLENPRDRGACWAAIYGVAQSWTRLKQLSSSSSSSIHKKALKSFTWDAWFLWLVVIFWCSLMWVFSLRKNSYIPGSSLTSLEQHLRERGCLPGYSSKCIPQIKIKNNS